MRRWILALLLLVPRAFGAAGIDFTGDFVSEYVFRGVSQRQGVSIQPSLGYSILDNLEAAFWSNIRLEDSIAISETNYSLQWTWLNPSPAAFTLGGIYYDRGSSLPAPETMELFAGVDFAVTGSPALLVFYDFNNNPGAYWQLLGSHSFLLPDYRGTVDVSGSLGFDTGRINGFNDARVSVGVTRYLGDWRLRPAVDLHFPSDRADASANNFRPVFRFSASRSF